MASAAGFGGIIWIARISGLILVPALAFAAYQWNVAAMIVAFFTGPGGLSRFVAVVLMLANWKSLPFAWTLRIFTAMVTHLVVLPSHKYTPDKLFQPIKTETHVSLFEVDYNVHKSNSTYFADLDISRTHVIGRLFERGCRALNNNATTKLITDPTDPSRAARGRFGIMLGGVQCSFKREIKPFQQFEMWSRVLCWDRKWLYIVTHFVEKGAVKKSGATPSDYEKKIFASAVSKYVFKVGRLTVHPSVVIGASGLLPERPGGWVREDKNGEAAVATNGHAQPDAAKSPAWDWRQTEDERRKGMEYAKHLAALDDVLGGFNGGKNGPLASFVPG